MTFKITQKDKLRYFYLPIIFGILLAMVISFSIVFFKGGGFTLMVKVFLGIFVFGLFLFDIPLIIFFTNYLRHDRNISLTIDKLDKKFIYENEKYKIEFLENDISKVIMFLPPAIIDKRMTLLHWDEYFYYEIISTKGNYKISCLVVNSLENFIPERKLERRKTFFPLIK